MGTVLGFDYGTKKIGVAVGQTLTGTANPLKILKYVKQQPDWAAISGLIDEWRPDALIVGYPLTQEDTETDATRPALRFSRQLEGRYHIKVHLADERYTTASARSDSRNNSIRRHEALDAMAAKLIIETWFESNNESGG